MNDPNVQPVSGKSGSESPYDNFLENFAEAINSCQKTDGSVDIDDVQIALDKLMPTVVVNPTVDTNEAQPSAPAIERTNDSILFEAIGNVYRNRTSVNLTKMRNMIANGDKNALATANKFSRVIISDPRILAETLTGLASANVDVPDELLVAAKGGMIFDKEIAVMALDVAIKAVETDLGLGIMLNVMNQNLSA